MAGKGTDAVKYTKLRSGTYHYNIPIPTEIRHLYPAKAKGKVKAVFDGTMKTTDAKAAETKITDQRAIMNRQLKEAQRKAEQAKITATLDSADADLLAELGGIDGVLKMIKQQRAVAAFTLAGRGVEFPDPDPDPDQIEVEGGDAPDIRALGLDGRAEQIAVGRYIPPVRVSGPDVPPLSYGDRFARDLSHSESDSRIARLTAETRRLKVIAGALGVDVPPAPRGIDEGITGIRELADSFMDAHNYTVQNRESVQNTIRRWTELHGDIPIEKWTRAHLHKFDSTLRGMPSSGRQDVRSLPILDTVAKGRADGLPLISYKTRKRYSDHMKAMSKYAVARAGLLQVDPFAGYEPAGEKVKHSKAKLSDVIAYTPVQVGMILDHCTSVFAKEAWDFWMPLIAAYTGARREEIGQLTVDNVRLVGNMHVIDITDMDPNQNVKNKHSVRSIPLPKIILDAGFVGYVQERKASGAKHLFQRMFTHNKTKKRSLIEVAPDKRGRFTEVYGRNFPRSVREPLGLTEQGMTFHSLRHSWTDAARRAKIDPEIRRKIAGRMENEDAVEGGYGSDELLADKLEALEQVVQHVRD